jgi:D-arabinose 1-dehydrogenase-like Zn-dependent alcohol dehydrogenase
MVANEENQTEGRPVRATLMYGAGDVRVEEVPDAAIKEPTDALVRVAQSCICGSDLWPYKSLLVALQVSARLRARPADGP